jgi:hypothetical protein
MDLEFNNRAFKKRVTPSAGIIKKIFIAVRRDIINIPENMK